MEYYFTEEDIANLHEIKPDWVIHHVYDEESFKTFRCDCHTHGLDKYNSKELQITLDLEPKFLGYILNNLGRLIVRGEKFKAGDKVFGFFTNLQVPLGFIDAKDAFGVDILRVWIPDENGKIYPEKVNNIYNTQSENPYKAQKSHKKL